MAGVENWGRVRTPDNRPKIQRACKTDGALRADSLGLFIAGFSEVGGRTSEQLT